MYLLDRNQDAERTTILATAKSPRISSIDHDTGTKSGSTMSVGWYGCATIATTANFLDGQLSVRSGFRDQFNLFAPVFSHPS